MKTELKTRWIEALLSGKYAQTQGELRGDTGWCCLGVLCEIDDDVQYDEDLEEYIFPTQWEPGWPDQDAAELPVRYEARVGLTNDQTSTLIDMNDNEGNDFVDIANWIRENV